MAGLHIVVNDAGRLWKDEVLTIAGERFERRLSQEVATMRIDMAKEFAAVRVDLAQESAATRTELTRGLASVLKWSFLFWIGQFAAVSAMMAFLMRALGPS